MAETTRLIINYKEKEVFSERLENLPCITEGMFLDFEYSENGEPPQILRGHVHVVAVRPSMDPSKSHAVMCWIKEDPVPEVMPF